MDHSDQNFELNRMEATPTTENRPAMRKFTRGNVIARAQESRSLATPAGVGRAAPPRKRVFRGRQKSRTAKIAFRRVEGFFSRMTPRPPIEPN